MNNNNLDQITMQSSKRKKARFNLKHSVDTSMGIGEIQALMCKEVIPNSKSVLSVTSVVRLDPMVAPTFGELNLHHNFMFVGMSDLFPKFAALLAQQPVQFGLTQRVPQILPHVKLKYLSALCLIGAKCTIYKLQSGHDTDDYRTLRLFDYSYTGDPSSEVANPGIPACTLSSGARAFYNQVAGITTDPSTQDDLHSNTSVTKGSVDIGEVLFNGYNSNMVNIGRLLDWQNDEFYVPSRNWSDASFFEYIAGTNDITKSANYIEGFTDLVTVGAGDTQNNDCCFIGTTSGRACLAAFNFSSFGQRFYKLLLGLGYGFDLCSDAEVSLTKLFAVFKAWFDAFAPTLYQGWETTPCAALLSLFDSEYVHDFNDIFETPFSEVADDVQITKIEQFMLFIQDLTNMWYTEEQDWITAHIRNSAVSPNTGVVEHLSGTTPNVNGVININDARNNGIEPQSIGSMDDQNGHAFINNVLHSQLDSEVLKRLYKVVNRNTIAGRRIKQLLEAQGLGDYVKRSKSNFIGHDSVKIDIFDVTSTSDTLERATGNGMYLGEYVGKGVGDGKSKKFKYSNDEFGFIIELAAIVPESGWTNGTDLSTRHLKKLDFYNPEYEAIGLEASPKCIVTGVDTFGKRIDENDKGLEATYGFIPRGTHHKVSQDILNGKFGLHSVQKAYLPYTFNKFVSVGPRSARVVRTTATDKDIQLYKLLTASKLPIASPMYRFVGRYAWMGRFMRIFADLGLDAAVNYPEYFGDFDGSTGESLRWLFCACADDPMIIHNVYLYDYYASMLPIEDSFETHEDGNVGYTDLAIGKA